MSSLIGLFRGASLALLQDQIALNATADNISQQNVAGYARRQVVWSAQDTVTLGGSAETQSASVAVTAQRDAVLDRSVASANAMAASASMVQTATDSLQGVFAINSSGEESSGIGNALSGFFSAVQSIAADPSSSSVRQAAYAASQAVVSTFQQTSTQISQQAASLNSAIGNASSDVNQMTAQIAALNGGIARSSAAAERDALVDQRTALVESLSKLVGIRQTINANGTVSLFTSSGAGLVVGDASNALSTVASGGTLHLLCQGTDVTAGLAGGSIGGALAVRDGVLATTQASLDALAKTFATAVNAVNAAGKALDGSAGSDLFQVPADGSQAAATIRLLTSSGDAFAAASDSEGTGGNGNANAMLALASQKTTASMSFADALSALVSAVGTSAAASKTASTAASASLTQVSSARDALSGVSLDTEAANLTQYQRSYQAEAKLLSVLNEIMATAINLGTETAVS